jgi:hypothetical protein
MVSGTLRSGASSARVTEGRLRGDTITFKAGDVTYTGRVSVDAIEGTMTSAKNTSSWRATRQ